MLVGYMRVSTADDRQSTDLQLEALIAAGVDERHVYLDRASGAKTDCSGLKACLDYLTAGATLVFWKLDRLGRALTDLLGIVTELGTREVGFRSLTEAMNTTTAGVRLLFSVLGALAEYERALIRERVRAGLEAARRRGSRGGRPLAIDPEKLDQIKAALAGGASKASVCRTCGVPRSTRHYTLGQTGV